MIITSSTTTVIYGRWISRHGCGRNIHPPVMCLQQGRSFLLPSFLTLPSTRRITFLLMLSFQQQGRAFLCPIHPFSSSFSATSNPITTPISPRLSFLISLHLRSGHRMIVWRNYIVLFGGFYEALREMRFYNDLFIYSPSEERWTNIPYRSHALAPRPRRWL